MIILASASPRRRELLSLICNFEVRATDCDENCGIRAPQELVSELSRRKACACRSSADDIVIGADTVVAIDGEILGKPADKADAARMLHMLSGRTHCVYTGVTVRKGNLSETFVKCTKVSFYELSDKLIDSYVDSGEPMDKAGAYGIQGRGCVLVEKIDGDYFNVVGLPVAELYRVLDSLGGV